MLSELQKKAAQSIVNIYETSSPFGEYGMVTVARNDPGHLTYGRSQTTLASGNLFLLIKAYCDLPEAGFGDSLRPFLDRLDARDLSLDHDGELHAILRSAGEDPVMHGAQDAFFDRAYWQPAVRSATNMAITSALGTAVVYDSRVHGSWGRIRDRVNHNHGRIADDGLSENDWIGHYVAERRAWLGGHSNSLLQRTVYRMDEFRKLIDQAKWDLALPLVVRGIAIDEAVLTGGPPLRVSAEVAETRLLKLRQPFMRGDDVRALQERLKALGHPELEVDGVFGGQTDTAVRAFQNANGLTDDGIVGPVTASLLDLD
jgi:chitosanase